MIPTKKLSKEEAKKFAEDIDKLSDDVFEDVKTRWEKHNVVGFSEEYQCLRDKVIKVFDEAFAEASKKKSPYIIDLNVGLCLYSAFNSTNGFTYVMANDDDIWRYLSCIVFPDITYKRYPSPEKEIKEAGGRINRKRFFSHTRRIWIKTLWWYVFLSWQGSEEKTREVLSVYGTDTISDLIERSGQGYRISLYRELMHSCSKAEGNKKDINPIQKQNLVDCRTVEPSLVAGGEKRYVMDLFKKLYMGDKKNASK